jgi:hypothetical protein
MALIALLPCTALAIGVLLSSHGSQHTATAADPRAPASASDFAVLAQKQGPGDTVPEKVKAMFNEGQGSPAAGARSIHTPSGKGWVVPASNKLCLVVPDPVDGFGVSCTPTNEARKRGALAIMGKGDDFGVTLVLPNGAKAVWNTSGAESPLPASSTGVVVTRLDAGDSLTVTNSAGTSTTLPAPVSSVPPPTAPADGPRN